MRCVRRTRRTGSLHFGCTGRWHGLYNIDVSASYCSSLLLRLPAAVLLRGGQASADASQHVCQHLLALHSGHHPSFRLSMQQQSRRTLDLFPSLTPCLCPPTPKRLTALHFSTRQDEWASGIPAAATAAAGRPYSHPERSPLAET